MGPVQIGTNFGCGLLFVNLARVDPIKDATNMSLLVPFLCLVGSVCLTFDLPMERQSVASIDGNPLIMPQLDSDFP